MALVKGKDVLISVDMGTEGSPNWMIVACSTSDGFSGSTDSVAVNNKCESGWAAQAPGNKSWSFSNSSYAQTEPEVTQLSYNEVFELWESSDIKNWKIEGLDTDYYREGLGYISDLSETAADGDYLTFDITVTGTGSVTNIETT